MITGDILISSVLTKRKRKEEERGKEEGTKGRRDKSVWQKESRIIKNGDTERRQIGRRELDEIEEERRREEEEKGVEACG